MLGYFKSKSAHRSLEGLLKYRVCFRRYGRYVCDLTMTSYLFSQGHCVFKLYRYSYIPFHKDCSVPWLHQEYMRVVCPGLSRCCTTISMISVSVFTSQVRATQSTLCPFPDPHSEGSLCLLYLLCLRISSLLHVIPLFSLFDWHFCASYRLMGYF